jgi:hypothetical protein
MPKEWHPRTDISDKEKAKLADPVVHTRQELMEYSLVPVPSNPSALLGLRGRGVSPEFAGWYKRRGLRQKYGSRGDEDAIYQYMSARVELCVAREWLGKWRPISSGAGSAGSSMRKEVWVFRDYARAPIIKAIP